MAKINAGKGLSQPSKASPPKGGKGALGGGKKVNQIPAGKGGKRTTAYR